MEGKGLMRSAGSLVRANVLRMATAIVAISLATAFGFGNGLQNVGVTEGKGNGLREQGSWPQYGGDAENHHYSSLKQINRDNVKRLAVAWSFDTLEAGGLQTTPIVVDGVLFGITPTQKVFALAASTRRLHSKFDSSIRVTQPDHRPSF